MFPQKPTEIHAPTRKIAFAAPIEPSPVPPEASFILTTMEVQTAVPAADKEAVEIKRANQDPVVDYKAEDSFECFKADPDALNFITSSTEGPSFSEWPNGGTFLKLSNLKKV